MFDSGSCVSSGGGSHTIAYSNVFHFGPFVAGYSFYVVFLHSSLDSGGRRSLLVLCPLLAMSSVSL